MLLKSDVIIRAPRQRVGDPVEEQNHAKRKSQNKGGLPSKTGWVIGEAWRKRP